MAMSAEQEVIHLREALAYLRTLYAVEQEIAEGKLAGDTAVSLRRTLAGPILGTRPAAMLIPTCLSLSPTSVGGYTRLHVRRDPSPRSRASRRPPGCR